MANNDQLLVDHLYNTIFIQNIRCNHFNSIGHQASNSVWNKHSDEKKILDNMVDNYKNYYKDMTEKLKTDLNDIKEVNINSFLTYDSEYHVSQYLQRVEEIDKYLVELDTKTFEHISKNKISYISDVINSQFPDCLIDPTLLGKLC
jgi:c-di-AMP phosphodiesterase-like protein